MKLTYRIVLSWSDFRVVQELVENLENICGETSNVFRPDISVGKKVLLLCYLFLNEVEHAKRRKELIDKTISELYSTILSCRVFCFL